MSLSAVRPKVLVWGKLVYAVKEFEEQVGALADIVRLSSPSRETLAKDFQTKYLNTVAIYHFHHGEPNLGSFDDDMFRLLPSSVKAVCHFGAGYDDVDVVAAKAHGVQVTHSPGAVDGATATTAIFLILATLRRYMVAEKSARAGNWKRGLPLGNDPENKTLGIVGMGGIGRVIAKRMLGWDMKVIYYNRRELTQPDFPCEYVQELDELLKRSDVVALSLPLNAKTERSFGKRQFDLMKEGAVLINTARGGVVDESALIQVLRSGKISAGLDVFPHEPEINPELLELPNVTVLPHMGTETVESRHKMGMMVVNNILAVLKGEPLINLVPEHRA